MTNTITFRRVVALLAVPFVLAACDSQPTGTDATEETSFEAVLETAGEGASAAMFLAGAPENVRLTAEQRTRIREINEAFRVANQADVRALEAITRAAVQARRGGASPEAIRGILEEALPVRLRLASAFRALNRDIQAVLTEAQRNWLRDNARRMGPQLPLPPRRP